MKLGKYDIFFTRKKKSRLVTLDKISYFRGHTIVEGKLIFISLFSFTLVISYTSNIRTATDNELNSYMKALKE